MEEITIKRENLKDVFSNLKVVKSLMNLYREDEDKLSYEKYLSEFVGIYCVICTLELEEEWQKWQIEYDKNEGEIK